MVNIKPIQISIIILNERTTLEESPFHRNLQRSLKEHLRAFIRQSFSFI